jgi:predicted dehydrogenase
MSDESERARGFTLKRREFLSSAAIPIAAALAPSAVFAQQPIRVGIIGAGGIVSSTHVPGLKRQPGVELVSVANRSIESSRRAADELGIRNAYANWEELLAAGGLDAVLIGTWPYMHKAITLAALDAGLHVLCQARMANTAAEARDMLAASKRHPNQICQLVPTSGSYRIDRALQRLLAERYVGDVLSVEVAMLQRGFASFEGELD